MDAETSKIVALLSCSKPELAAYVMELRTQLAKHDGCSRWSTKDMRVLAPFQHSPKSLIELDKNHLDQFENISPPMRSALTIPTNIEGIVIYVCSTPFGPPCSLVKERKDVLRVARGLQWGNEAK